MRWTESITVDRPLAQVQRAIADENELMRWSAWPAATGFSCAVEGDGRSRCSHVGVRSRGRSSAVGCAPSMSPTSSS